MNELIKENRFFSTERALLLQDSEFQTEDFGEVNLKWYVSELTKPLSIVLSGTRLDVSHVVLDARGNMIAMPASQLLAIKMVETHNLYITQGDASRDTMIQHMAALQKRLDAAIPGRVPRRGPKTKAEKLQEAAA